MAGQSTGAYEVRGGSPAPGHVTPVDEPFGSTSSWLDMTPSRVTQNGLPHYEHGMETPGIAIGGYSPAGTRCSATSL